MRSKQKATVINGHHDVNVTYGILQHFNFDLVFLRLEFNFVRLQFPHSGSN
jgi:hypothetical protein